MSFSVLRAAAQTYGLIWRQRALVLRFALVPWILLSLAWHLCDVLVTAHPELERWLVDAFWLLGRLLVLPLAIQCCRLKALGPDAVRRDGFYRLGPEIGKVAVLAVIWFLASYVIVVVESEGLRAIAVQFVLGAGGLLSGEPSQFLLSAGSFLVGAVFLLATIRAVLRLLLVFPGLCLGRPWELRDHWQETRGKTWSLLGLLIATTLPVALMITALEWNPLAVALEGLVAWPSTALDLLDTLLLAALECFYEAAFAVATTFAYVSVKGLQPGAADSPSA